MVQDKKSILVVEENLVAAKVAAGVQEVIDKPLTKEKVAYFLSFL